MAAQVLRKFYLAVCRAQGVRPFRWSVVVRPFNRRLKEIYGTAIYRTYRSLPMAGGAKKKRFVYRIPTRTECEAALAQDEQSADVVPLRR